MEDLTLKSICETALKKSLPVPNDAGLVLYESSVKESLKGNSKGGTFSKNSLIPTEEDMELINQHAMDFQEAHQWITVKKVNVLGDAKEPDYQGDTFSGQSEKNLIEQAVPHPILTDHNHAMGSDGRTPPVGFCIKSVPSPKGPIETWAIPLTDYNASIVQGIKNGSIRSVSVGMLISPHDKVCNSCNKSIYSYSCPHEPGQMDEMGKPVTVSINKVNRYLEASFVNAPARIGAGIEKKSVEVEKDLYSVANQNQLGLPTFAQSLGELQILDHVMRQPSLYKNLPLLQSRVDNIVPTQSGVNQDKVNAFISDGNYDGGFVLNRNDNNYMMDGHHRLEAAKQADRSTTWNHTMALPDTEVSIQDIAQMLNVNHQELHDSVNKSLEEDSAATIGFVNTIEGSNTVTEKAVKEDKSVETEVKAAELNPGTGDADPKKYEQVQTAPAAPEAKAADKEPDADDKAAKVDEDDECMKKAEEKAAAEASEKEAEVKSAVEEKAIKVEAKIDEDSALTIKSLITSNKEVLEMFSKAMGAVELSTKAVAEIKEVQAKQSEQVNQLCEMVKETSESVKKAAEMTVEDLLEKVMTIANAAHALQTENKSVPTQVAPWNNVLSQLGR